MDPSRYRSKETSSYLVYKPQISLSEEAEKKRKIYYMNQKRGFHGTDSSGGSSGGSSGNRASAFLSNSFVENDSEKSREPRSSDVRGETSKNDAARFGHVGISWDTFDNIVFTNGPNKNNNSKNAPKSDKNNWINKRSTDKNQDVWIQDKLDGRMNMRDGVGLNNPNKESHGTTNNKNEYDRFNAQSHAAPRNADSFATWQSRSGRSARNSQRLSATSSGKRNWFDLDKRRRGPDQQDRFQNFVENSKDKLNYLTTDGAKQAAQITPFVHDSNSAVTSSVSEGLDGGIEGEEEDIFIGLEETYGVVYCWGENIQGKQQQPCVITVTPAGKKLYTLKGFLFCEVPL